MRILDRYILKSFLVNYLLALGVLVGMFILFDLIVNINDFARGAAPAGANAHATIGDIVGDMFDYYLFQLPVIYQQVAGIIPLLAAGFTMVRMTRTHELTAMLASGVSLYRVATPIIVSSIILSGLQWVNQEYVISRPYVIQKILRGHSEVNAVNNKSELLLFAKAANGTLLSASEYYTSHDVPVSIEADGALRRASGSFVDDGVMPGFVVVVKDFAPASDNGRFIVDAVTAEKITLQGVRLQPATGGTLTTGASMRNIFFVMRNSQGIPTQHTIAKSAHWELTQAGTDPPKNCWRLWNVTTENDTSADPGSREENSILDAGDLNPEQIDLLLSRKAVDYLSTARVHELATSSLGVNQQLLYKVMYLRITQPIMNLIMLLIGIPFLLTREPARLVYNMSYCTVISGIMFISTFVIFQMAGTQIDPMLGAFLPVLIFGPFAGVMLDTIKT